MHWRGPGGADGRFAGIEELADQCRFRDCRHESEPGCGVRAALESGKLDPGRFANYLKLRDEIAGASLQLASRLAGRPGAGPQPGPPHRRGDDRRGKS